MTPLKKTHTLIYCKTLLLPFKQHDVHREEVIDEQMCIFHIARQIVIYQVGKQKLYCKMKSCLNNMSKLNRTPEPGSIIKMKNHQKLKKC